jgi:hypothetical protein
MAKTYEAGKPILTVDDFDAAFKEGTLLFVKNWNKTAHPIILANMQYRTVKFFIERKQLFIAKKIEGGNYGSK